LIAPIFCTEKIFAESLSIAGAITIVSGDVTYFARLNSAAQAIADSFAD